MRKASQQEKEKFCLLQDARRIVSLEAGDEVAAKWFNDPNFYIGTLERSDGDLGGNLGLDLGDSWGSIDEAYHVVLLKKEKKILSIIVKKRTGGYMASIKGTNISGSGKTPACAIGKVILIHSEILCGIEIKQEKSMRGR